MATQDEMTLYKIDYSTTHVQPNSKLCNVPDEVLLEIGKHFFSGFALEFRSNDPINRDTDIASLSLKSTTTFSEIDLAVLRSCKVLRQKLLPLLADLTNLTIPVTDKAPSREERVFRSLGVIGLAGPSIMKVKLAKPFCAKIKVLEASSHSPSLPDPAVFENLESLVLNNETGVSVSHRSVWENDEDLFLACLAQIKSVTREEYRRVFGDLLSFRWEPVVPLRWVARLIENLKTQSMNNAVNLKIVHSVEQLYAAFMSSPDPPCGKVVHDATAETIERI